MLTALLTILATQSSSPQSNGNPIFPGWYADPEIHLYKGRYVVYPTTSDRYEKQTSFKVFTSTNLKDWKDGGIILDFKDIPWSTNRAAWAPSVIQKKGTYYMYFSAGDGAGIGVATSKSPTGPFRDALGKPLIKEYHHGAQPIDANAFTDDDGKSYLYYGGWRHAIVVRLGDDMISTVGEFKEITPEHYVEGPYMLKRNGKYYYMWSEGSWGDSSYGVAYAVGDSPMGPFVRKGKILQTDPKIASSTGHHSVLKLPRSNEYVICYHRRPLNETARDHREVCLDKMVFEKNGDIRSVIVTNEGVKAWRAR